MRLLIFGGTTEGRELLEALLARGETDLTICVATEYGTEFLPKHPSLRVLVGRLDGDAVRELLRENSFSHVIDATHPYADKATENIREACAAEGVVYLRLLRASLSVPDCIQTDSTRQAADFLNTVTGNVLVTTGSKELAVFTAVEGYRERLFARVLPTVQALEQCRELGFSGRHVLAMQGPFSEEFNLATLRQINAKWLVTKESGAAGGFAEKCRAAERAGAQVVLVGRPPELEAGYSQEQILEKLFPEQEPKPVVEKYFPMFVPLTGKHVIVFGGGAVAQRRVQALLSFGCRITVIAPESAIPEDARVRHLARGYEPGDTAGADLVLAATDSRAVNHAVYEECRQRNIPVNTADCKEECDFYFPALVNQGAVVIGVTASGTDHTLAAQTAGRLRTLADRIFPTGKEDTHETDHPDWEPGK